MKTTTLLPAILSAVALHAATVDQVIVRQQWPWSTDVKVEYRITGVTSPVDISVVAYDGDTPLDSSNLAAAMKGDLFGIAKDRFGSFTIDPVKAFGKGEIAVMNFNVRLTTTPSAANMTDVLYKVVDLDTGAVTDITRADFYGGKYGSFTTNFSDFALNGVACTTDFKDVLIWTEVTNNPIYKTDKLVLRRIPAASWGPWMMDAPGANGTSNPSSLTGGSQQHLVQLTADYYAGVFPVTQAQYMKIAGSYGKAYTNAETYADHAFKPTSGLDWSLGNAGASLLTGKTNGKLNFSLPTEAQWEFAARGGVTNNVLFSKDASYGAGTLRAIGWNSENILASQGTSANAGYDQKQTVPVGRLAPNGFGLYDILGNVLEPCLDFSSDSTYSWPEGEAVVNNPTGVDAADAAKTAQGIAKHIFRGGSIGRGRTECTLRSRFSAGSYTQNEEYGFRVICTVAE